MDPLKALDDWLDDDRLTAAKLVIEQGAPVAESDRSSLALAFGDELQMIGIASTQLRLCLELWHAEVRPIGEFKNGLVDIRREEVDIAQARRTYQRALTNLRLTAERKAARSNLIDTVCTSYDDATCDLPHEIELAVEEYRLIGRPA